MSKVRVKVSLVVATQTDAKTVKAAIDDLLVDKPLFAVDGPLTVTVDEDGRWTVTGSLRFQVATDAETVYTKIKTSPKIQSRLLPGSTMSMHVCPHEESSWWDCKADPMAQYQEVVK